MLKKWFNQITGKSMLNDALDEVERQAEEIARLRKQLDVMPRFEQVATSHMSPGLVKDIHEAVITDLKPILRREVMQFVYQVFGSLGRNGPEQTARVRMAGIAGCAAIEVRVELSGAGTIVQVYDNARL
jgi:hypothetical protein